MPRRQGFPKDVRFSRAQMQMRAGPVSEGSKLAQLWRDELQDGNCQPPVNHNDKY